MRGRLDSGCVAHTIHHELVSLLVRSIPGSMESGRPKWENDSECFSWVESRRHRVGVVAKFVDGAYQAWLIYRGNRKQVETTGYGITAKMKREDRVNEILRVWGILKRVRPVTPKQVDAVTITYQGARKGPIVKEETHERPKPEKPSVVDLLDEQILDR